MLPYSFYVFPLLLAAIATVALALIVARRQSAHGAIALILMLLGAAIWAGAYAVELVHVTLPSKLFWAQVQYIGIVAVVPAWFHLFAPICAAR